MLQALTQTSDETSKEEVFDKLVKAVSAEESMIPPEFKTERNWEVALTDVLLERLLDVNQPIIIAVDNLHLHKEVSGSMVKLRKHAKDWGFRLFLISRPEISSESGESLLPLPCNLWSHQETEDLLNLWVPESLRQSVSDFLRQGWFQDQKEFSLFLIQTVAMNAEDLALNPTDLLQRAIEARLLSLKESYLSSQHRSLHKYCLIEIRDMLEQRKPPDTILKKFAI